MWDRLQLSEPLTRFDRINDDLNKGKLEYLKHI